MLTIDLPGWPAPRKIEWKPRQPTQINRSEFTGAARATILGEAYWQAQVEYASIIGEDRFRPWRSAFMRLQGRANAFRLSACEGNQVLVKQAVVVDGGGQQGFALATRGWYPGLGLLDGMMVTIGEDLHQVVADAPASSADGRLVLSIMPHIANNLADGTVIEVNRPWGLMRMTDDAQGWTVDAGQEYSIAYGCESA